MTTKDTPTLLREIEEALIDIGKRGEIPFTSQKWLFYCQDVAKKTLPAIQELIRRASVAPVASGWMPIEREELAQEIACYFAGFSFSRHELKECLGLVDVLIIRGLIAKPQPPQAKGAGE